MTTQTALVRISKPEIFDRLKKNGRIGADMQLDDPASDPVLYRVPSRYISHYTAHWPGDPAAISICRGMNDGKKEEFISDPQVVYKFAESEAFPLLKILTVGVILSNAEVLNHMEDANLKGLFEQGQQVVSVDFSKLMGINMQRTVDYFEEIRITEEALTSALLSYRAMSKNPFTKLSDVVQRLVAYYQNARHNDSNSGSSIQFR